MSESAPSLWRRMIIGVSGGHLTRRFTQLYLGLVLYGVSISFLIRANLGLDPWNAFHIGISKYTGITVGNVTILISVVVLLLWIPLRQRLGIGTISNAIVVGLVMDLVLPLLHTPDQLWLRILFLSSAVLGNAVATGLYIGAHFGPGPRDGLMTGLSARTGWKIIWVRTGIEATVLLAGWFMGSPVGVGTVAYAFGIGPLVHVLLPRLEAPINKTVR